LDDVEAGWIPVAFAGDVPAGVAAPAIVAGREVVVWRTAGGDVRAFADRCPHRGMRLSFGFVRGETLACLYHGWRWRADATCAAVPAHPDLAPPPSLRADAYVVTEASGLVWIASAPQDTPPPEIGADARPLASLVCERPAGAARAALGARGCVARVMAEALALTVAIQPAGEGTSMLHVLLEETGADPARAHAALDAAEALRDRLERLEETA